MVCANLLARQGLKVLLTEQHYMVGGYCSTFRRGGFTFDASTHFYPLLGNPETLVGRLLAEIGCTTEWIHMDPVDAFHLPDGTRFEVPADFDTYRRRLDEEFPEQRENLDDFFEDVRRTYLLGTLYHFRGRPAASLGRYADLTLDEVLRQKIPDPRLRLLLTADVPHWGSPPERTSFVFDSMLRLSYFLGNYYPKGGSQVFADDLATCFERAGGDIAMSSRVGRIRVEEGCVAGVEFETVRGPGRGVNRVNAPVVVSNADLKMTLGQLLPRSEVPPAALAQIESLRPSFPCFLTHIGLSGFDQQRLEAAQGYYWKSWDANAVGRDALRLKIFSPTQYDPSLAPEGKQIVILQKVVELGESDRSDPQVHKNRVEAFLLGELETILPGISDHIEVALTASAQTAERFTLNQAGAMLGWEMASDQLGDRRPGVEGPLPGLYCVGHWVRPGGGITPVMVSAIHASKAIAALR